MFWGPDFVLAIIGMAMFAGVLKTAIRAKHGLPDPHPHSGGGKARRAEIARLSDENTSLVTGLREDNARLVSRLESYEDRLIVLERIVTDRGYALAHEIEALRDARRSQEMI